MIKSLSKSLGASRTPSVRVSAFGKHPVWDDHIDDVGLSTDELVDARRTLYADCIAGSIDSGAWGAPDQPPPAWLVDYGHEFVWYPDGAEGTLLAGRLWPSRDGRRRTKYPMVLCAQCDGVGLDWVARVVLPRLAALQAACIEATEQSQVIAAVEAAGRDLQVQAAQPGTADEPGAARASLDRVLASPLGEGSRAAMHRVQYQFEREFSGYLSVDRGTKGPMPARGQHIRVPGAIEPATGALVAWTRYFARQLSPESPRIVAVPFSGAWADVSVGQITPQLVSPWRANFEHSPPASEVPYTITEAFARKVEGMLDGWQGRASAAMPVGAPSVAASSTPVSTPAAPATAAATESSPALDTFAGDSVEKSGGNKWMGVAIAGGVLVIAIVIAAAMGLFSSSGPAAGGAPGGGSGGAGSGSTAGSGKTTPAVTPAPKTPGTESAGGDSPTPKAPNAPKTPEPALIDPRASVDLGAMIAGVSEKISNVAGASAGELKTELQAITAEAAAISGMTLSRENAKSVADRLGELSARAQKLAKRADDAKVATAPVAPAPVVPAPVTPAAQIPGVPEQLSVEPALNAAWVKQLDLVRGLQMTPERLTRLTTIREMIEGFSRGLPKVEELDLPAGAVGDTVRGECTARRQKALAEGVRRLDQGGADLEAIRTPLETLASGFKTWTNSVVTATRAHAQADTLIRSGASWREVAPSGRSLSDLSDEIRAMPPSPEISGAFAPLIAQLDAMRALATSSDRAALSGALLGGKGGPSSVRTAMDRLVELTPAWPGDVADLGAIAPARVGLRASLDAARAQRLDERALRAWLRLWGQPSVDVGARGRLVELMPALGIDAKALPTWAAYNLARYELRQGLQSLPKRDDASARPLIERFASTIEPLAATVADAGPALKAARALLETPPAPRVGPGDFPLAQGGAGRAKWTPAGDATEDGRIAYTLAVDGVPPQTLVFAPVEVGGKTVFVSTTEVSVGVASSTLAASGRGELFATLTQDWNRFVTRRGLRTWEPLLKSPVLAGKAPLGPVPSEGDPLRGWLPRPAGADRVAGLLAMPEAPGPQWNSPMQGVSPEAASVIASAMNCRLPSVDEWRASLATEGLSGSDTPPVGAQLRGRQWKKQFDATRAARAASVNLSFPQDGSFTPAGAAGPTSPEADDDILPIDEPSFLMAPVDSGPGKVFKHLIGNVWEWVLVDTAKFDRLGPDDIKPKSINVAQEVRVIGGSSLSSPSTSRTQPHTAITARAAGGFSDVGFRVAFSSERGMPKQVLASQAEETILKSGADLPFQE